MKQHILIIFVLSWINSVIAQSGAVPGKKYYCAPCGCKYDSQTFNEPGKCPDCKMRLLEEGTFNFQLASVSKDGSILYSSNKKDNKDELYLRTAKGVDKLIGEGSSAQLSPDGKKVVLIRGENSLSIYDVSGNSFTDLGPRINLPGQQTPAWNPSGDAIIFCAGKFPNIGLYQFNLQTEKTEPLMTTEGLRYACMFSPDGKKIAFRCVKGNDQNRQRGIALLDLASKEEKYVSPIGEYPTWSPDGRMLAFHWPDSTMGFCIYTVNADGTDLKKIAGANGSDFELPVWSTDGKTIYFQTNKRKGNWEIWSMRTDGTEQKPFLWE
jgi:Tol biopolymer transport system component